MQRDIFALVEAGNEVVNAVAIYLQHPSALHLKILKLCIENYREEQKPIEPEKEVK